MKIMNSRTIIFQICLIVILISILPSCRRFSDNTISILPDSIILRNGDVVFRRGGGMASQAVLLADKDGFYSHCGIVVDSAGVLLVVHAVPGEPDFEGDPDRVKADKPATFFSNVYANAGEVCRTYNDSVANKAAREAWRIYKGKMLFDNDYDSNDTTQMYCTEFVYNVFQRAGCTLCGPPTHRFDLPGIHTTCWLPSDLYNSPYLKSLGRFKP